MASLFFFLIRIKLWNRKQPRLNIDIHFFQLTLSFDLVPKMYNVILICRLMAHTLGVTLARTPETEFI